MSATHSTPHKSDRDLAVIKAIGRALRALDPVALRVLQLRLLEDRPLSTWRFVALDVGTAQSEAKRLFATAAKKITAELRRRGVIAG